MANPSKNKGTLAETAIVRYLRANGFSGAERRALAGAFDLGDITGCGPIVFESKAYKSGASDGQVAKWLAETDLERQNADADYGLLVMKRPGIAGSRAGEWWAVLPAWQFVSLIGRPGAAAPIENAPIRLLLRDAVTLLRLAGYGDDLDIESGTAA